MLKAHDREHVLSLKTSRNLNGGYVTLGGRSKRANYSMCDKKNSVLFTDTGCFVLSPDFKLADESQATTDLHCYGIGGIGKATQSLLFTWVFILATKDETSGILKRFLTETENLVDKKVKMIRCDNGTEFKNRVMSEFCEEKGIKKEFRKLDGEIQMREESIGAGHSSKETGSSQDYILMPLWKDGSLFDSSLKNASNDEPQTFNRRMTKTNNMIQGFISAVYEGKTYEDLHTCLFGIGDVIHGKRAIGTKWVYRNKKDERGIVIRYQARCLCLIQRLCSIPDGCEECIFVLWQDEEEVMSVNSPGLKIRVSLTEFIRLIRQYMVTSSSPRAGDEDFKELCTEFEKIDAQEVPDEFYGTMKTTSTIETLKPLMKDENAEDVDVHLHRSMIGSFDVFNIFQGLYNVLMYKLISLQCKKQTIVANSTTEAEYVAAASCCGQVLWIQNQMLDYGYNFMNTKIFIDNESTICIVKNPVFHSKTKHIEIRHHFIRDSNEKKLIQMIKIHTDQNVADLLTKAFDVGRFQYLIASIGMLNL
ncbi:putative ribonuclease H-like domain-containing protein [Tanacetum coccineum]